MTSLTSLIKLSKQILLLVFCEPNDQKVQFSLQGRVVRQYTPLMRVTVVR